MMSWPPYSEPMAVNALRAYKGDCFIFIGESQGGCTANDAFFSELGKHWAEIADCPIVQWSGIHDHIWVYERKATRKYNLED